jgi:hypothetical protein
MRFSKTKYESKIIQRLFNEKYGCYHALDGSKNRYYLERFTSVIVHRGLRAQHLYYYNSQLGLAAPIQNIPIALEVLKSGLKNGGFGDYCPVNIVDRGELYKEMVEGRHADFAVEYKVTQLLFLGFMILGVLL